MFLILAAQQILPHGVNAISQMGVLGTVLGSTIIIFGILNMFLGSVMSCHTCIQNSAIDSQDAEGHARKRYYFSFFATI